MWPWLFDNSVGPWPCADRFWLPTAYCLLPTNFMFKRFQHIHFIGIGGIGMSGIAEVLANMGFRVSGSDHRKSEVTSQQEELRVEVNEGNATENVGDAHVVVRSTAVRDNNPKIFE